MNRNELSFSLPHSLGGFEPSLRKDDTVLCGYPRRFDDHEYHNTTPPEYTTLGEYRNPPPEYRVDPPPIATCSYDTQAEPPARSPHFFEFSHITRYPVPSTLPIPSSISSCQRDQPTPSRSTTMQSQRSYDIPSMYTELGDQRLSTSSVHSRPASLFDGRTMGEIPATQCDSSINRQYYKASCGGSVSGPTRRSGVSDFEPSQQRYVC